MLVDKNEWQTLQKALDEWVYSGKLDAEKASELKQDLIPKTSDRQQIAQYFFIIALSCILLAFATIFIDDKLLEKIKHYFDLNNIIISVATAILGILWFWYILKRRQVTEPLTYEIYMTLGGLLSIISLVYLCKQIATGASYAPFLFIAFLMLGTLSVWFRSKALWIGAILAVTGWYGLYSFEHSNNNLFLDMNYPVRFVLFGTVLAGLSFFQLRLPLLKVTGSITYTVALAVFFTGLWGVSVFGNYNTIAEWEKVRQTHVLTYAVLMGLVTSGTFLLGIRFKEATARDFGITFLLADLYTCYFEFFWDTMNKGIFFLILAATFWFVGKWLEKSKRKSRQQTSFETKA